MNWRFSEDGEVVERECLLFEAGSYPDKGVIVTEDDLRAIAGNSDAAIPMKIEHLAESPFDRALGTVTRLRVVGRQLWGTLRQPVEMWRLAQWAGAKALSVALDVAGQRIVETSFVCHPRVAGAQVFCDTGIVHFQPKEDGTAQKGAEETMTSARQLAEGMLGYLRGFLGADDPSGAEEARFATTLAQERAQMRTERAEMRILEWKRQGRLRASDSVERAARLLLTQGEESVIAFDGKSVPVSVLFAQFVAENGPVVPMGEWIPGARQGGSASERLMAMARERARQENIGYVQAFVAVTAAHPEMAQAAREEI